MLRPKHSQDSSAFAKDIEKDPVEKKKSYAGDSYYFRRKNSEWKGRMYVIDMRKFDKWLKLVLKVQEIVTVMKINFIFLCKYWNCA